MVLTKDWWVGIFMFTLVSMVLLSSQLVASGLGNVAALRLVRLTLSYYTPGVHSFRGVTTAEETTGIEQVYGWALLWNPDSTAARWGLGRAALASGDYTDAAETLQPLTLNEIHNSVLYFNILEAFSYSGKPEDVISLYETNPPPQQVRVISDTVALAYLGREEFEHALIMHPGDLCADYHLWQEAQQVGDMRATHVYSQAMVYFPLEAIDIANERLLGCTVQLVPELLREELWSRDKTLNVASYLVWQRHQLLEVARLLETMSERYPDDPDWVFYLGELYHRQGDLDRAELAYRRVLEVDPKYSQVYLRMGMVSELQMGDLVSGERLEETAMWYERYHEIAPDDLLGLKKLLEVYQTWGQDGELSLQKRWLDNTEEGRIVAQLLNISSENVELGPNLMRNGGFENWTSERLEWWTWSDMFNREPFSVANFVAGVDGLFSIEGRQTARVHGFWLQQENGKGRARAGFWQRRNETNTQGIKPNTVYLVSFYYSTSASNDRQVGTWWPSNPDLFYGRDYRLPGTGRSWHRFVALFWYRDANPMISPLLRSWGTGAVYFDDVQIMEVKIPKSIILQPNPIVEILPKGAE